ncbi:hypothetical protein N7519_004551 [Penicillium mononematosum]|uniref:uncharacterized protein n=1 Tax=Penicillium mononematosum TaxID=268346 RepID=UPI002546FFE8|nr:uncharacterized protein N7519_004551 [Penicillium mononematosum]KAJ6189643.1 hypothetical protein N7519_004551 [Penicillium mononematosum]
MYIHERILLSNELKRGQTLLNFKPVAPRSSNTGQAMGELAHCVQEQRSQLEQRMATCEIESTELQQLPFYPSLSIPDTSTSHDSTTHDSTTHDSTSPYIRVFLRLKPPSTLVLPSLYLALIE